MKFTAAFIAACFLAFAGSQLVAQEFPEMPGPEKEHQWLQQFVGEWDSVAKASMGPDQPDMESKGTMSSHMLGDRWIVNKISGDMMGTQVLGLQTIGYDPTAKKYVGTWVDSMSNHMWKYEGTVDESGKKITLEAEGPNFMAEDRMTMFRDAYEFKSADHIVATSSMQDEEGNWVTFMTGDMHRSGKGDK